LKNAKKNTQKKKIVNVIVTKQDLAIRTMFTLLQFFNLFTEASFIMINWSHVLVNEVKLEDKFLLLEYYNYSQ
jgi:hypothetical protein